MVIPCQEDGLSMSITCGVEWRVCDCEVTPGGSRSQAQICPLERVDSHSAKRGGFNPVELAQLRTIVQNRASAVLRYRLG